MTEKEITIELKTPEILILLLILSLILFLELTVTFNSPIAFGDEGFHTRMAQWIGEEREYPVSVPFRKTKDSWWGFFRPPLWNLLEGSFFFIFGFNESIVKFLTPFIASVLSGLAVYILVKKLYNEASGFFAAMLSVTIPSFVTYSVLFYVDILFTFYFSLFILTFILANREYNKKYLLLTGMFGAFAFLTKTTGYAVFLLVALGFLYQLYKKRDIVELFKKYLVLGIPFLIIIPFFGRSLAYYHTPDCALPIFDSSGCSVSGYQEKQKFQGATEEIGTEMNVLKMGFINYLNFAYGNVWFVPFIFLCGLFVLTTRRERNDTFVLLSLIALVFIFNQINISLIRAEDVARFTLGWISIIALAGGLYLEKLYSFTKKYQKHVALMFFIFVIFFSILNLTCPWPLSQDGCVKLGATMKLDTMKQVKQFSPSFFEACDWVKQNVDKDARIMTVWVHHAAYNCQRSIAAYSPDAALGADVNETLDAMKRAEVTHVFIQKFSITDRSDLSEKYSIDFLRRLENNPEHFEKIYENGLPLQQCMQHGGCDGSIIYEVVY